MRRTKGEMQDLEQARQHGEVITNLRFLNNELFFQETITRVASGETILIDVRKADYNKKYLYTTQEWIDCDKLGRAHQRLNKSTYPVAVLGRNKDKVCVVILDGNHRLAIHLLQGDDYKIKIIGQYDYNKHGAARGFNAVYKLVRRTGIGSTLR